MYTVYNYIRAVLKNIHICILIGLILVFTYINICTFCTGWKNQHEEKHEHLLFFFNISITPLEKIIHVLLFEIILLLCEMLEVSENIITFYPSISECRS